MGEVRGGRPVMEVGAFVVYRGRTWQVVAVQGQRVYLLQEDGQEMTLLAGRLFADPGFEVVGGRAPARVPQWGLFETVPVAAQRRALAWLPHIREVETGLPCLPGEAEGVVVRAEYDPARWTLAQRDAAKAREMSALGFGPVARTTVERMRHAYRRQGLWGLVDKRSARPSSATGRADERVVAAVLEAMRRRRGRSKGTVKGLRVLAGQVLEETHGRGVVALPSPASFYRLVNALADPGERPGRAARTATGAGRWVAPLGVVRPGEQVQIDTTRLDVMAVLEDGSLGRPELTIAVDVATRSILAAVLCPAGTKAVDAALLLAEMAVPHPVRPTWPAALELSVAAVPYERLLSLDERLEGAAARPVVVPETIVVDRGKVFVSEGFVAACETLGISVQPAPPRRPTAKAVVERTFGAINTLFCQHVAGHTGSNVLVRGRDVADEACWTVPQLQDFLDEWIVCGWQRRPHEGLRNPVLPRAPLSPNQAWAALIAMCGYVPLPLTGRDYLELLPVRWHPITERGIRIDHRTYDDEVLGPVRGQSSGVTGRQGRWEVHHNPHDGRQIWVRMPDGHLAEVPWIHRDHVHRPFDDHTWRQVRAVVRQGGDREQHEAELADALDRLMRRMRNTAGALPKKRGRRSPVTAPDTAAVLPGLATGLPAPRRPDDVDGNGTGIPSGVAPRCGPGATSEPVEAAQTSGTGSVSDREWGDSLDALAHTDPGGENADESEEGDGTGGEDCAEVSPAAPRAGFGLYDAQAEAESW